MKELWQPVSGYEDLYSVSNWGRVKSLPRWVNTGYGKRLVKERILKQNKHTGGYLMVGLCRNGRKTSQKIHSLVLTAFVGACPEGKQGCHGDGDKTNNCLTNLRWDTPKNNGQDKILHGTVARGERNGYAKLTEAQVKEIRARHARGESQGSIAADFGIDKTTISDIHRRKSWAHVA